MADSLIKSLPNVVTPTSSPGLYDLLLLEQYQSGADGSNPANNTYTSSNIYLRDLIAFINARTWGFIANRNGTDQTGCTASANNKIAFNNVLRNDGSYFDGVTNYRFTPPAGVYRAIVSTSISAGSTETGQSLIYKNGSETIDGNYINGVTSSGLYGYAIADIAMNGTDYLEGYGYCPSGVTAISGNIKRTFFSAYKIRD